MYFQNILTSYELPSFRYFLSTLLVAVSLVYFLWKRTKEWKLIQLIPGFKPWPVVGDMLNIKTDPVEAFSDFLCRIETKRQDGISIFRLMVLETPWIVIYSADTFEKLLNNSVNLTKSSEYDVLHRWLGLGLLTSDGAKWKSRRRILTPGFHFSILQDFMPLINSHAQELTDKLMRNACDVGGAYDIYDDIALSTLDIICDTAMGTQVGALSGGHSKYVDALNTIKQGIDDRNRSLFQRSDFFFSLSSRGRKVNRAIALTQKFTLQVIEQRRGMDRTAGYEGNKKHKPFLDLLLDCTGDDGLPLTDSDIREEVDTFMFEGQDTTSSAIAFTIYLLGRNVEAQRRCQRELDDVIESRHDDLTFSHLSKLSYLECCIKESMRLLPAVQSVARQLSGDTQLDGYTVPKGTTVLLVIMALHRDPKVFPNPLQFQPDRFSAEQCSKRHPFSYVPFSAGPRNCIGQRFAMMEVKVILAKLLMNFNIESTQTMEELGIRAALVLHPSNGVKVKLSSR